jgi:hypothetical protein
MFRLRILLGKEDYPAAYKVAGKIADTQKGNPQYLNELSWQILTDPKIKQRDLGLAEKIAVQANEAAKGGDANIVDTLARARFMRGNKEEAIALQEQALKLVDDDRKDSFQRTLDSYKKGELPKAE